MDVAHRASLAYLARGQVDGAAAAARAGLGVEPQSGQLWDDLLAAVRERDGAAGAALIAEERAVALGTGPLTPPPVAARLTA